MAIFHQRDHFSHSSSSIHLFVRFIFHLSRDFNAIILSQAHYIVFLHTNLGLRLGIFPWSQQPLVPSHSYNYYSLIILQSAIRAEDTLQFDLSA